MDTLEKLSKRRRILLLLIASTFLVWQVPGMDFVSRITREPIRAIDIMAVLGGLAWALLILILVLTQRRYRNVSQAVNDGLEDELVKANRVKAFQIGYIFMLITAGVLFALSLKFPFNGGEAAHQIIVVGIVAPIYAFVVLESRHR